MKIEDAMLLPFGHRTMVLARRLGCSEAEARQQVSQLHSEHGTTSMLELLVVLMTVKHFAI